MQMLACLQTFADNAARQEERQARHDQEERQARIRQEERQARHDQEERQARIRQEERQAHQEEQQQQFQQQLLLQMQQMQQQTAASVSNTVRLELKTIFDDMVFSNVSGARPVLPAEPHMSNGTVTEPLPLPPPSFVLEPATRGVTSGSDSTPPTITNNTITTSQTPPEFPGP
jgi:multidrug efflux pump subunit AcrA (membrane-fusion protein)